MIDLFDGNLRGTKPAHVNFVESVEGEVIDYDLKRDLGLIRIRLGRSLPVSPIVPPRWKVSERMQMLTVGCSEGKDPTVWSTQVVNPLLRGLSGNPEYEAIECTHSPKQGRTGAGLFTDDGYLAGVCNFAEPRGNRGLYATPVSIYQILDRNGLEYVHKKLPYEQLDASADEIARSLDTPRSAEELKICSTQSRDGGRISTQSRSDLMSLSRAWRGGLLRQRKK